MSCLDCVIDRTKKRRMLTVWGREGKPANRRRYSWRQHVSWQSSLFYSFFFKVFFLLQEEASRGICDDRPSVPAVLSERKMDSSNHNKVKVMATQLLAKFEENAPAPQTGLKRQVGERSWKRSSQYLFLFGKYSNKRGHMTEGGTGRLIH